MGSKRRWWQRASSDADELPWLEAPSFGPVVFEPTMRTAGEVLAEKRSAEAAEASHAA